MALAIFDLRGRLLLVRRPAADREFPSAWGLPAASCRPGESPEEAARRVGPQKLGAPLRLTGVLARGRQDRPDYRMEMVLYLARLESSEPRLPPSTDGDVTLYEAWRWGQPEDLEPAARAGSLCSILLLESRHLWDPRRNGPSRPSATMGP